MLVTWTVPVFIDTRWQLPLLRLSQPSTEFVIDRIAIHVGVFATLMLLVLYSHRVVGRQRIPLVGTTELLGMLTLFTLSLSVGQFVHGSDIAFAYYGQTILPLFAFWLAARLPLSEHLAARIVVCAATGSTLLLWLGAIYAYMELGSLLAATRHLANAVPQYLTYFPGVLAINMALATTLWPSNRRLAASAYLATLLLLPFVWARTGFVMIVLAVVTTALVQSRTSSNASSVRNRGRYLALVLCGVLVLSFALYATLERGVLGERVSARSGTDDLRVQLTREGFKLAMDAPLLGQTFHPHAGAVLSEGSVERLFGAHNQYLDYALRGGLLATALFLLFQVRLGRHAWKTAFASQTSYSSRFNSACLGIMMAFALGNAFALLCVQAYTGTLFWFLAGLCSRRPDSRTPMRIDPPRGA